MAINTSDEVGEPHADNSDIVVVKKTFRYSNVFLTTTYAAIPYFGT